MRQKSETTYFLTVMLNADYRSSKHDEIRIKAAVSRTQQDGALPMKAFGQILFSKDI